MLQREPRAGRVQSPSPYETAKRVTAQQHLRRREFGCEGCGSGCCVVGAAQSRDTHWGKDKDPGLRDRLPALRIHPRAPFPVRRLLHHWRLAPHFTYSHVCGSCGRGSRLWLLFRKETPCIQGRAILIPTPSHCAGSPTRVFHWCEPLLTTKAR